MEQQKTLPTYAELHHDINQAFKNDQLNLLLNQPPHADWVKKFPAEMRIPGGGQYLPVDKVDWLMTAIFQEWYPEILREGALFNSVYMIVRLHYKNPLTGEWQFKDGCGATNVQIDAGKNAADLSAIKARAVQMALPIAKQLAKKDAADELGALFGRDLNRKDTVMFAGAYGDQPPQQNGEPYQYKQYTQADIHAANANYVAPVVQPAPPPPIQQQAPPPPIQPMQQPQQYSFNANDL